MKAGVDDGTAWLRDLARVAGPVPQEPSRYARQLDAIEGRLLRRRTRRGATLVGGGLLVATAVCVAALWLRVDAATNVGEARTGFEAPASSERVRHEGRAQRGEREPTMVRDHEPPPEPTVIEDEVSEPSAEALSQPADEVSEPERPPKTKTRPRRAAPVDAATLLRRANEARADRRADDAREALVELRRRFPRDAAAEHATFLLGRVERELGGDPVAADAWFQRYLEEYPDGRFAAAARGRLLRSYDRGAEPERARAAARDYLAHHPGGPYADLARDVLADEP